MSSCVHVFGPEELRFASAAAVPLPLLVGVLGRASTVLLLLLLPLVEYAYWELGVMLREPLESIFESSLASEL